MHGVAICQPFKISQSTEKYESDNFFQYFFFDVCSLRSRLYAYIKEKFKKALRLKNK